MASVEPAHDYDPEKSHPSLANNSSNNNNNNNTTDACCRKAPAQKNGGGGASGSSSSEGQQRGPWMKLFGKAFITVSIISFLYVGLWINLLQAILVLTSKLSKQRRWRTWHKRLLSQLVHILFAQPIFLLQQWSRIRVNIQLADKSRLLEAAKQSMLGIMVVNHTYSLDYMAAFVVADQLGLLGYCRTLSKAELKYLPVIGWALWLSDFVFVERDWRRDRLALVRQFDQLLDYPKGLLGIYAEGTRWVSEKHERSQAFARSRGIEPLKYHLLPRSRGFNLTLRHYLRAAELGRLAGARPVRLFNLQIMMPDGPRFVDFVEGRQLKADVYCEEVELSRELLDEVLEKRDQRRRQADRLDGSDDDDDQDQDNGGRAVDDLQDHESCPRLTQLLHEIYRRKDKLVEEYKANGNKFVVDPKRGGQLANEQRAFPTLVWWIGFLFTFGSFVCVASYSAGTHAQLVVWSLLIGFIGACFWMLRRIEHESTVEMSASKKGLVD